MDKKYYYICYQRQKENSDYSVKEPQPSSAWTHKSDEKNDHGKLWESKRGYTEGLEDSVPIENILYVGFGEIINVSAKSG